MTIPLKLLGISGSLRKASYNTALIEATRLLLPKHATIHLYPLDEIPLFNSDIEDEATLEPVEQLKQAVAEA
ncbi:MAG: NAD(P)H-dependent oxidoreductase, partial [Myxococcota bacterium]